MARTCPDRRGLSCTVRSDPGRDLPGPCRSRLPFHDREFVPPAGPVGDGADRVEGLRVHGACRADVVGPAKVTPGARHPFVPHRPAAGVPAPGNGETFCRPPGEGGIAFRSFPSAGSGPAGARSRKRFSSRILSCWRRDPSPGSPDRTPPGRSWISPEPPGRAAARSPSRSGAPTRAGVASPSEADASADATYVPPTTEAAQFS